MTVSQAQRGGRWNELGVFAFDGGQDYAISLSGDANGTVVADALYIVKVEELTDAVTWAPALPAGGTYQVYAKWTADEARATDARYRIVHEGGTAEVSVNQRVGGGLWHYLGSYAFDPLSTPTVTLAANDNGSVAADAVRFVGGPAGATDIAYLHNDHAGTPQAMTDAAGQLLWWRDQTPFGQTVAEGGFSTSPLRFPGQYADAESGLHYNYFRDYDPALGRYIQSDPIGLRGGLNTYGYVKGNPLRYTDPRGQIAIVPIVVGFGVGFGTDALIQYAQNGCIDVRRALISGLFGALGGGLGQIPFRTLSSALIGNALIGSGLGAGNAVANGESVGAGAISGAFGGVVGVLGAGAVRSAGKAYAGYGARNASSGLRNLAVSNASNVASKAAADTARSVSAASQAIGAAAGAANYSHVVDWFGRQTGAQVR